MIFKLNVYVVIFMLMVTRSKGENDQNLKSLMLIFGKVYQNILQNNGSHVINTKINANEMKPNYEGSNDELCDIQTGAFLTGIGSGEEWALRMFDSWSKLPSGILEGNLFDLGHFDECVAIKHDTTDETIGHIQGRYCFAPSAIDLSSLSNSTPALQVYLGTCFPASCSSEKITEYYISVFASTGFSIATEIKDRYCFVDEPITLDVKDISAITILSIIIALMIASTTYDIILKRKNIPRKPILLAFSVYTNGKNIFSVQKSKSPNVIHCINGIRTLTLFWVLIGHGYNLGNTILLNAVYLRTVWIHSVYSMVFQSGYFAMDSFLFLGGFIVAWSMFRELDKNKKINLPLIYVHRYLRLTPLLAIAILFQLSLYRHIGSGPMKNESFLDMNEVCEKYWWSALLHIQTFFDSVHTCLSHTWYISIDFQLFLFSPLVIYPLWRWKNKFIGAVFALILGGILYNFLIFYLNDYVYGNFGPGVSADPMGQQKLWYTGAQARSGPYFVGIIFAYFMHNSRDKKITIPFIWVCIGWLTCFVSIAAMIFGPMNIVNPDKEENSIGAGLYSAITRPLWGVAIGWIIFACHRGYGGFVNLFLSHAYWQPLARLSYAMYLHGTIIQVITWSNMRSPPNFSDYAYAHKFWGDLGFAFVAAIFLSLAFETPIPYIETFLFKRTPKPQIKTEMILPTTITDLKEEQTKNDKS